MLLLNSDTYGQVEHGFDSNENYGISQVGGTCSALSVDLVNQQTSTYHNPLGFLSCTSLCI